MESNVVVMIAGAVVSLLFGYVPKLRPWFEALDGVRKAQIMALALVIAAVLAFAGACYSPWQVGDLTCDEGGFWRLLELLFAAALANQATYVLAVRPTRTVIEQRG